VWADTRKSMARKIEKRYHQLKIELTLKGEICIEAATEEYAIYKAQQLRFVQMVNRMDIQNWKLKLNRKLV
jgi:hypothetical protein